MILGMPTATYTLVHIIISLIGIGSGFLVMFGLLTARRFDGATALFLVTTVLTSVTGFGFPFDHLLPSHVIGIISLIVLAIAILARYAFHMAGGWRASYVIGATLALYLNVFVFLAQLFQNLRSNGRRGDLTFTGFQLVHDFVHCCLQRDETDRAFLARFSQTVHELAAVERFMCAVALDDAKIGALDLLVGREPVRAL